MSPRFSCLSCLFRPSKQRPGDQHFLRNEEGLGAVALHGEGILGGKTTAVATLGYYSALTSKECSAPIWEDPNRCCDAQITESFPTFPPRTPRAAARAPADTLKPVQESGSDWTSCSKYVASPLSSPRRYAALQPSLPLPQWLLAAAVFCFVTLLCPWQESPTIASRKPRDLLATGLVGEFVLRDRLRDVQQ